jgi:septal ring factor EnvC (AmiA/AmiB activator)
MSAPTPQGGDSPQTNAGKVAGGATRDNHGAAPGGQAPKKRRNPWIWISALLAVVVAGLLVWALKTQSDLDSTQQDVAALEAQAEKSQDTGSAVVGAVKAAYDDLTQQLGSTSEDLAAAEQKVKAAEETAAQAEQDAAAAKQHAAQASNETDKAKAQADQAKAEAQAAESKAAIAADCAKAYASAFGSLFEGDSVSAQASAVKQELGTISASCKASLAGG